MAGLRGGAPSPGVPRIGEATMADLLYVALALGAFALFALAVEACDKL
jgi:hypothetical protein